MRTSRIYPLSEPDLTWNRTCTHLGNDIRGKSATMNMVLDSRIVTQAGHAKWPPRWRDPGDCVEQRYPRCQTSSVFLAVDKRHLFGYARLDFVRRDVLPITYQSVYVHRFAALNAKSMLLYH